MLVALTFSATTLGAISMFFFVYLTAFKYKDNIRGYVPAGFSGLIVLAISSWFVLMYLSAVARRHRPFSVLEGKLRSRSGSYLLGGIIGVPTAFILCSIWTPLALSMFDYTLQTDIILSLTGAVFMAAIAIWTHIKFMNKKSDNQRMEIDG